MIGGVSGDSHRERPLVPVGRFPHLVIVEGFNAGRTYRLTSGTTSIGRDPRCDVVLAYSTVSWHHASVTKRGDRIVLRDLGSRNGTFVGLDRIARRELEAGDLIRFGDRVVLKLVFIEVPRPS
jgi:pSer/pThr/pTyr-binding forkhead associated (FHA) protein